MIIQLLILLLIIIVFFTGFYLAVNTVLLSFSWLMGSPFVRTRTASLKEIFSNISLQKSDVFYDLGCGDGSVVRWVAKQHAIRSVGIDINFILIFRARLMNRLFGTPLCTFLRKNILTADFSEATIIYLFLFPKLLDKLGDKIEAVAESHDITLISHGFAIDRFSRYQIQTISRKPFSSYIYRITAPSRKKDMV